MSASSLIASPNRRIGPAPAVGTATHRGIAFGLVAALIWGSYMAISNHGIEAGLRPADLAFILYMVAAVLLLPWFDGLPIDGALRQGDYATDVMPRTASRSCPKGETRQSSTRTGHF